MAGGEADLVVEGSCTVLVEVKSVGAGDPFVHVDESKERVLRRLASALRARRIDVVGVVVGPRVTIHAVHGW